MNNKVKLSIILPVYNTEKYLAKCFDSILYNDFKDYELICINDGTKDNSESIILEYINKFDGKMKYIKKENGGLSDTRNLGIQEAKGEYISFIDSDDYIEKNMYLELFKKLEEYPYDLIVCDLKYVYEDKEKSKNVSCGINHDIQNKDNIKEIYKSYYPAVWNKIYKKELIEDISFTKGVWYEDMEFMLKLLPNISSIGVVHIPLYNYLQRENSITYTYNEKLYDIINNMDRVLHYYKEKDLFNKYYQELEYLTARYYIATFLKRIAKAKKYKIYIKGVNFVIKKIKEIFPYYKNNKYLNEVGLKGFYIKHFNKFFAFINYIIQNI